MPCLERFSQQLDFGGSDSKESAQHMIPMFQPLGQEEHKWSGCLESQVTSHKLALLVKMS